ncbi:MAG: DNA-binding response OmpR family regulator [Planctomycetota bacterium]|jgi:DNA-binding response OmpR family regulator
MRILVVEDSKVLRDYVAKALKASGYAVDVAEQGDDGLALALDVSYDAIVLDIMLPALDGISVLKKLREAGRDTPILFLSAKDTVEDRVQGLRKGADDYLVKPFELDELLARVEVLCRRRYDRHQSGLQVGDLELDSTTKQVSRAGHILDLPAREFALLELLMAREGDTISRSEIEEHIYDDLASPMSNVVDSAIYALRRKIAVHPDLPPLIHTRRGMGYVLELRSS